MNSYLPRIQMRLDRATGGIPDRAAPEPEPALGA
jgi:hypothetical protein